jgi:N-carbamoylputrescine amidase
MRILILTLAVLLALPAVAEDESKLRVAQLRGVPTKWDLEANFAVFVAQVPVAAEAKADIFITPECWLDGYASPDPESTPERLREVAQPLEGSDYLDQVSALAKKHKMWICFGFTSIEGGAIYNACGLWDRTGKLVGMYHKTHIQNHDKQYAIGMGLPVFDSEWGNLGMMICADRRWPETVRTLRLKGARLILNPSYGSHSDWNKMIMQMRAWENQCYIAFTHPNQSLMVDPGGEVITQEDGAEPAVAMTDIDLTEAKDDNHIQDRRPELYSVISDGIFQPSDE